MPININGNIISSGTTNSSGTIVNYPNIVLSGMTLWSDAGRSFSYYDTTYYDCGYGCQYYSTNPGCTNCNTYWLDMSTNYYRGTLTSGPTFNYPKGGYFSFDGTNDCIIFNPASSGSTTGNFTFGGWVNPNSSTANKIWISRGRDGAGSGWSMYIGTSAAGNPLFSVVTTSGGATAFSAQGTTVMSTNTWYYVMGTWTAGSNLKVYLDGVLENTTNTTTTSLRTSTEGIVVGSVSTTIFYNVSVATVQVYDRVLTDSEILQNYNSDRQRFGK
jgi:hypothetical protein